MAGLTVFLVPLLALILVAISVLRVLISVIFLLSLRRAPAAMFKVSLLPPILLAAFSATLAAAFFVPTAGLAPIIPFLGLG